jgi:hypothetical protein
MTLRKVLRRLNSTFNVAHHSITLANTVELLRRYELEQNERLRDGRRSTSLDRPRLPH